MPGSPEKAKFITETTMSKLFSRPIKSKLRSSKVAETVAETLKNYNMASFIKYKSYQENISAKRDINRLTKQ